jgi:multidrug efflux pump
MNWVKRCLHYKLPIYLLALSLCLLGLFCVVAMPITPFPSITFPEAWIQYSYPGASPSAVQTQVTQKIVDQLQSVQNIQDIMARSMSGSGFIGLDLNTQAASQLLQTKVDIQQAVAAADLPTVVQQPTINFGSTGSGLIRFVITSDRLPLFKLDNFVQSLLYPKFRGIPGVSVDYSTQMPEVKISLMPEMLAQYHLNVLDVTQRINAAYQQHPLGSMYVHQQQYLLGLTSGIHRLDDFSNILVGFQAQGAGLPVYLKDVAKVSFESGQLGSHDIYQFNGSNAASIDLSTRLKANPFAVSHQTRQYVEALQQRLPSWIKIQSVFDNATIMQSSIDDVVVTILIASVLILLIALVFLGHLRTTIIPIITIPICLLGTIAVISMIGFSVNLLTLLAMVIAVGLVVDDAIVVVENISRHIESGMSKYDAVLQGTQDIALTIVGITATLLAVYLPIAFCQGFFIELLKVFAVPLATAVFISGILSLTLTPVMSIMFISDKKENTYQKRFAAGLAAVVRFHHRVLNTLLKWPIASLLVIVVLISAGIFYALKLPQTFFPTDPTGNIQINMVASSSDDAQDLQKKSQLFKRFYTQDTVKYRTLKINKDPYSGQLTAQLSIQYKPQFLHQNATFLQQIKLFIKQHKIERCYPQLIGGLNMSSDSDMRFFIYGAGSAKNMNHVSKLLQDALRKQAWIGSAYAGIDEPQKQLAFDVDSVKAAKFGVYSSDISQLLSTYYGGYQLANHFSMAGLDVPVDIHLADNDLQNPDALSKLTITGGSGNTQYPIAQFVKLHMVAKPGMITTFDNHAAVQMFVNLAKGHSLGATIKQINALLASRFPFLQYQYMGDAKRFLEGNSQTLLVTLFGLLCVYFLLAVLFNSLVDPLIILLTVPFSIVGGALSLYFVGGSLNLFSVLGLVTLIGLITKHGVLIVQFANQALKNRAKSAKEAIMLATQYRLRPIVMTTLAMTLGALPLLMSGGFMFVAKRDLGVVIMGGLLIGTLFSLIIVPLVYVLVKKRQIEQCE